MNKHDVEGFDPAEFLATAYGVYQIGLVYVRWLRIVCRQSRHGEHDRTIHSKKAGAKARLAAQSVSEK